MWRVIDDRERGDGAWNMALDEALWQRLEEGEAGSPTLRLYEWVPACLSLGFHQPLSRAADLEYCRSRGFDVVRRPTGGKAVLHQHELTYSVVAPNEMAPFSGGLHGSYGAIADALAEGLGRLGIEVTLEARRLSPSPAEPSPCFLVPTEKEILVGGRKVIGSAQKRGRRAFLQHGSIPLRLDYEALALATRNSPSAIPRYREAFAGLEEFRPGLTVDELRDALREGFSAFFGPPWHGGPPTAGERETASRLREKYLDPALPSSGPVPEMS